MYMFWFLDIFSTSLTNILELSFSLILSYQARKELCVGRRRSKEASPSDDLFRYAQRCAGQGRFDVARSKKWKAPYPDSEIPC